jgi:hypothetical protein
MGKNSFEHIDEFLFVMDYRSLEIMLEGFRKDALDSEFVLNELLDANDDSSLDEQVEDWERKLAREIEYRDKVLEQMVKLKELPDGG